MISILKIPFKILLAIILYSIAFLLLFITLTESTFFEPTNLNIREIKGNKDILMYNMPIDIFVNYNGEYVGVMSFIVEAGYNFDKIKVDILNTGKEVVIELPEPEIKRITKGATRWILSSNESKLFKEFWKYGEVAAKYIALSQGILEKANENTRKYIESVFYNLFGEDIKVKILTTINKQPLFSTYTSQRCGFQLKILKQLSKTYKILQDIDTIPLCLYIESEDKSVKGYVFPSPLNIELPFLNNEKLKQFSLVNPNLKYTALYLSHKNGILFGYNFLNRNILFIVDFTDVYSLEKHFPFINYIASSFFKDYKYNIPENSDCFGTTKLEWETYSLAQKRTYIDFYFIFLDIPEISPVKHVRYLREYNLLFIEKDIRDSAEKQKLLELVNDLNETYKAILTIYYREFLDKVFFIFTDAGNIVIIWVDKKIFGNTEIVANTYSIKNFFKYSIEKDGKLCIIVKEEEKCLPKEITNLVKKLKDYGFLKFFLI